MWWSVRKFKQCVPKRTRAYLDTGLRVAEVNRNRLRDYGTSYLTGGATGGYLNSGGGPSTIGDSKDTGITALLQPALNVLLFNNSLNTLAMLKLLRRARAGS